MSWVCLKHKGMCIQPSMRPGMVDILPNTTTTPSPWLGQSVVQLTTYPPPGLCKYRSLIACVTWSRPLALLWGPPLAGQVNQQHGPPSVCKNTPMVIVHSLITHLPSPTSQTTGQRLQTENITQCTPPNTDRICHNVYYVCYGFSHPISQPKRELLIMPVPTITRLMGSFCEGDQPPPSAEGMCTHTPLYLLLTDKALQGN